jgi:hypothetical protein
LISHHDHDSPRHRWYGQNGTHPFSSSQGSRYICSHLFSKRYCAQPIQGSQIRLVRRKDIQEPFQYGSQYRPGLSHRTIGHGPLSTVKPFIDLAISKGVKRFVLLTASQAEIGSPVLMGKVHEYLLNIKVDYTVLRPTWFIRMTCELVPKDKY